MTRRRIAPKKDTLAADKNRILPIKQPKYRIVPDYNSKELMAFDICMMYKEGEQPQIYMDQDLMQIISTLVARHKQLIIKVNWFSSDVLVITPSSLDEPIK